MPPYIFTNKGAIGVESPFTSLLGWMDFYKCTNVQIFAKENSV